MLERAERLERGLLKRSSDYRGSAFHLQCPVDQSSTKAESTPSVEANRLPPQKTNGAVTWRARAQHTGLGFVHGRVGIRLGGQIVLRVPLLAFAEFPLVFALATLCGLEVVALVAAVAEARICARTLRLLGVFHGGGHDSGSLAVLQSYDCGEAGGRVA